MGGGLQGKASRNFGQIAGKVNASVQFAAGVSCWNALRVFVQFLPGLLARSWTRRVSW